MESNGVKIGFHIHEYTAIKNEYVILCCKSWGLKLDTPGLALEKAQDYIDEFLSNTGYAYIA